MSVVHDAAKMKDDGSRVGAWYMNGILENKSWTMDWLGNQPQGWREEKEGTEGPG